MSHSIPPENNEPTSVPAPPAGVDGSLVEDFRNEATDLLQSSEGALLRLEVEPRDEKSINTVFRAFHTIKGVSSYLQLTEITELAHRAESLLSRVRSGQLLFAGAVADGALRAVDAMKSLVRGLGDRVPDGVPHGESPLTGLIKELEFLITGQSPVSPPDSTGVASEAGQTAFKGAKEGPADDAMRVKTERLDRLINAVGELSIAQSMLAQDPLLFQSGLSSVQKKVAHLNRIVRDLQNLSLTLRMVPLKMTFQKMQRLVRDMARKTGKKIDAVLEGESVEIDRAVVDTVDALLLHMVRNAVDHGLETPEERQTVGKPPVGKISLSARHEGGYLWVEVADDGRGLNREKILARALAQGLCAPDVPLSDEQVYEMIFLPGFSTAERVTEYSGRGVGMDVVKKGIENMHGQIRIFSRAGEGSRFVLRVPLSLAIVDSMLVRADRQRYLIPTLSIQRTLSFPRSGCRTVAGRGTVACLPDETLPLVSLSTVLGAGAEAPDRENRLLVVVEDHGERVALDVDELLGQQRVVAKSLGEWLGSVPGVAGGAILEDGGVGLILDPSGLIQHLRTLSLSAPAKVESR